MLKPFLTLALIATLCSLSLPEEPSTGKPARAKKPAAAKQPKKPNAPAEPSGGSGGEAGVFSDEQITVGAMRRAYRLVVPEDLDESRPAPLVFSYHGLGDSKDLMSWYSRLDDLAKKRGFILVYPNSVARFWPLFLELAKDDLAFFDALYDTVTARYNSDLNRVYLTGMSNGAYFNHLIASQRSGRIAAIAAHSGGLGMLAKGEFQAQPKYAVLMIHGDADSIVRVSESRHARDIYKKLGHEVELIEVPGFNHFWAHKIGVNDRIWDFFAAHPRQALPIKKGE